MTAERKLQDAIRKALDHDRLGGKAARDLLRREIEGDLTVVWLALDPWWDKVAEDLLRATAEEQRKLRNTKHPEAPLWTAEQSQPKKVRPQDTKRNPQTALRSFIETMLVPFLAKPMMECNKEEWISVRERSKKEKGRFASWEALADHIQQPLPPRGITRDFFSTEEIEGLLTINAPALVPHGAMA